MNNGPEETDNMVTKNITDELKITIPDGYREMTEEEYGKAFGATDTRGIFGVRNEENKSMLALFWVKPSAFIGFLADASSVAESTERRLKALLKDYAHTGKIRTKVCGKTGRGFTYRYLLGGEPELGRTVCFKHKGTFYTAYWYAGEKEADLSGNDFDEFLNGMETL